MKTLFFLSMILFLSFSAHATDPRIKSWKTLTNENGYEFKYPDCWAVVTDDPDETNDPITKARDIVVKETKSCARPLLDPPQQNLVGFRGGWDKTPPKDQIEKKLERLEKDSSNIIASKDWMFFKRLKIGSNDAYVDVKVNKGVGYTWIYWELKLFCSTNVINYSGPAIKNPDETYINRFKSGDLALPEPEKTIFESIRCTDAKN